jgi:uncharacterized membrane protein YbaN (DUF454 family)
VARGVAWALIAVLGAAAAFELALALGAGSLGSAPGEGVPGEDTVAAVALLGMLAGVFLASVLTESGTAAGLAPAAAAFVTARFFTYDPYYAPTLRRYSDGGAVPAWWIFTVIALALFVATVSLRARRVGAACTALTLLLCIVTAAFTGTGH